MSRVCHAAGHKFIPNQIKEDDLYGGISNVLSVIRPEWPSENIKYKVFLFILFVIIRPFAHFNCYIFLNYSYLLME